MRFSNEIEIGEHIIRLFDAPEYANAGMPDKNWLFYFPDYKKYFEYKE